MGPVAQWSEQGTHNPLVVGSIPTRPTMNKYNYFQITNTSIVTSKNKLEAEKIAIARQTEFVVELKINDNNLSYKSDFSDTETVFWLEAVRDLIIKKSFENTK